MRKDKFTVTGMSCSACSSRVERTVEKLDGIVDVSVNLLTGSMSASYNEDILSSDDICEAVKKAGYGAFVESDKDGNLDLKEDSISKASEDEARLMKRRLIFSVAFLIPLMCISMGPMLFGIHVSNMPLTMVLAQIVFLIPIVFLNRKYFVNGIPSFFRGSANMDTLVAMGSGAAILYGVFALFKIAAGYESGNMALVSKYSADIYFESAGTILTLITVGKYLESVSKGKTSLAIEKLVNMAPKTANVIRDGSEVNISVKDLVVGDILVVRPGESIACDGVIVDGSTSVDQSAITGESIPVEKFAGDSVVSATINKTGYIKVKCLKVGEDSTINQIIRLVEEASASKAPIARLADKIAGVFVPTVMVIALVTTIGWLLAGKGFEFALSMGICVLVISCPCALGLATPVAIMVGTGRGAQMGILIKSGEAFENASYVDTVVLDKTGTVTEGKPVITDIISYKYDHLTLLSIAGGLENGSEHPLAEAIVDYCNNNDIELGLVSDFRAFLGKGIEGIINGELYFAGNMALMAEKNIDFTDFEKQYNLLAMDGKTPLIFADSNEVIGIIAVADVQKPSSKLAIDLFKGMGLDVVMLTGDNKVTAEAIKEKMGIPKVIAEVFPSDKEKHISNLQNQGHRVAMVGDGINDAPALAKADVGIAIGAGTDVAIESADVVLLNSDLLDAVNCLKLSKSVIRNIKENLFWAFFYNSIGIPVAAGLLYPFFGLKLSPMIGALAMSLSSVCVVTNALRLRFFKSDSLIDSTVTNSSADFLINIVDNGTLGTVDFKEDIMKYELGIDGMMCMHCQKHALDALTGIDGVNKVDVDLESGKGFVESGRKIDKSEFEKAIVEAGYTLSSFVEL